MPTASLIAEPPAWQIPAYAQTMLFVQSAQISPRPTTGPRGTFTLPEKGAAYSEPFIVRWGHAEGPPLGTFTLRGNPPSAHWDGAIVVGGAVGSLQVEETRGMPLVIAHIEGAPLDRAQVTRPTLQEMTTPVLARQNDSVPRPATFFTYTIIVGAESPLADYLFQAMALDLGVVCTARLGPDEGKWHEVSGLPLLGEKLTVSAAPIF